MTTAANIVRYAGIACELVGFTLIALDIGERRRTTDQQSIGEWVTFVARRIAQHLPFRRAKDQTVVANAASMSLSAQGVVTATGEVGPSTPTVEERIAALEKRIDRMERRASGLEADLRKETDERQAADEKERQAREATDERVQQLVVQLTAGNLWLERIGVVLFGLGLLLTNLSEEIGGLF